ncbi:lipoprotein YerB [Bacillus sp. AFS015802]|uniref:DUF3048 domain-containing protein n=1 Tax=Bacillus sp. AFS015802 TaxID=2033486 RepID=UPI000BF2D42D|nr:DUF3048 domain-containing protein [Bacillus sp. AFS015802]PFA68470.1 lipoprotein YerB [Bacillus sp. AFS015802]
MLKRALIIALSSFTLVACSSDKEIKKESDKEAATPVVKEETGVETEEMNQSPLTGMAEKKESTARSVAVMVNNHPKARPQSGLSKADIVYEVLAEGDITRFLAIFQSRMPKEIGPVRSARDYYIKLAKGYDSLYVAHGYSPEAKEMLTNGFIDDLNGIQYDGTLFKRASFRKAPHNSYITYEHIKEGADKNGFDMNRPPQALNFSDKGTIKGETAKSVMISYNQNPLFNVVYDFNEKEGRYERFSNGEQTIDYDSEDPVLVENLLIAEASHKIVDDKGRRDIDLESGGNAYLIQEGKLRKLQWKNVDGRILPYENNQPVSLRKGSTWINVIPSSPGLTGSVSYQE